MKVELTQDLLNALDADQLRLIIRQIAEELKTTVDNRIDNIKAELVETTIKSNDNLPPANESGLNRLKMPLNSKHPKKAYTKEFIVEVMQDYNEGTTIAELIKKYNLPTSTIYTWIHNQKKKL
ncbi:MAG: helix-turn-helix domain-containing protein [Bacteroidales bacterium]